MYKRLETEPFQEILKSHFKIYHNTLNVLIRYAKDDYFCKTLISVMCLSSKELWRDFLNYTYSITTHCHAYSIWQLLTVEEGNSCNRLSNAANFVNHYFVEVGVQQGNSSDFERGGLGRDCTIQSQPVNELTPGPLYRV